MIDLAQMAKDLAFAVADLPVSVTVDGVPWVCTAGDLVSGMSLDEGGMVVKPAKVYTGAVSSLSITPTLASVIVDAGKTYRVTDATKSIDGLSWALTIAGDWK